MDIVQKIISFENGEMSDEDIISFFAELVKSGKISHLQGSYQRIAKSLIENGYINYDGDVL